METAMFVKLRDISALKMASNPPECVKAAGCCVIRNGMVKKYVGIGWIDEREASEEDYGKIPQVLLPHCSHCKHYETLPEHTMYCGKLQRRITSRKKPCPSYEENF